MHYQAIIVGGGSGSRFNAELPKQFHLLAGKPVLMHTISAFVTAIPTIQISIVLNVHFHSLWEELCRTHHFTQPHQLVKGGQTRFDSVKNGLKNVPAKSIVAIHDAVRPLISTSTIVKAFAVAEEKGSAVVAIPANESLRRVSTKATEAVNRADYWMVQTPQIFPISTLKKAYIQPYRNEFTDDASVVERTGIPIHLVEGEATNIKITYPQDLAIAELLLNKA